jgi:subtilisin family serine protease
MLRRPIVPAALAHARGWMPREATGTPAFLAAHPEWDGRGVLLGILDSGLDPGAAGFDTTTTGRAKLLELRDFSGEGRIPLTAATLRGDTLLAAGRHLTGVSRVRGIVGNGSLYAGEFRERALGEAPASDVNDNATDSDTLAILVGKASDGWVLFADTDGDGSLADERPVHDYLTGRETFGWHRSGEPPPLMVAVNFTEGPAAPLLDLFFDTSGHGTHVAGIAAARGIGGVAGFDGAAPGSQLLGLKIARNDFGGITTTGSVLAAMDYAIRFAAARRMPLVLNMSFGVGNAREGAARLDQLIDSVLVANPEVIFVTSAGNDGPGLSTMGFPGSALRAITVGATEPGALSDARILDGRTGPDLLVFFSSRGGELAKPDVVVPGIAYSTVPRWDTGEEIKAGTSMASPHVAGIAAVLASAALAERRAITADDMRRALTGSGRPVPGGTLLDAGAGVPELSKAWSILRGPAPPAEFDVESLDRPGTTAAFRIAPGPGDSVVRFRVTQRRGTGPVDVTLASDTEWLLAPKKLRLDAPSTEIALMQRPPRRAGEHVGGVRATMAGVAGPVFTLVSTVVVPEAKGVGTVRVTEHLATGTTRRVTFAADSGRPFQVRIATASPKERLIAALHLPGGQPIPGDNGIPGGSDTAAAVFDVDGRDARDGFYEAVAATTSRGAVTAMISVDPAPAALSISPRAGDSIVTTMSSLSDSEVLGRLRIGVIGGQGHLVMAGSGGADVSTPLPLPKWGRRIVIDLELDPELWPRFSDFGFTLLDSEGHILGKNPVNYPSARLAVDLPPPTGDETASLVLSPAFAEPGGTESWSARITIRIEAEGALNLGTAEGEEFSLQPKAARRFTSRVGELPWQLPEGFVPLGLFFLESAGTIWSWEHAFEVSMAGSKR